LFRSLIYRDLHPLGNPFFLWGTLTARVTVRKTQLSGESAAYDCRRKK
jgi:hypothetical protein